MQKISSQDAKSILKQASSAIRNLSAENERLATKLAAIERERRIEKIARSMDDKGLNGDLTSDEKIASLRQARNLDVVEEAVKIAAPNIKLASVTNDVRGSSLSAFENFILTGEDASE